MVGIVRAGHVLKGGMNTNTTSACRQGEVDSDMTLHMSDDAADDSTPTNTVLALVGPGGWPGECTQRSNAETKWTCQPVDR